jgi:hypothetical protein
MAGRMENQAGRMAGRMENQAGRMEGRMENQVGRTEGRMEEAQHNLGRRGMNLVDMNNLKHR